MCSIKKNIKKMIHFCKHMAKSDSTLGVVALNAASVIDLP